ncbi:hypothetical protein Scep_024320 [Stephania cephalantha]|uniref:Aldehyde dehydrogenase domain-containing protein n=1 Tax=Stephania cephalantha TaxID=152367 RepID=A0AAP0HYC6_9MAGN
MAAEINGVDSAHVLNIPKIKFTKLFINGQFVDALSEHETQFIKIIRIKLTWLLAYNGITEEGREGKNILKLIGNGRRTEQVIAKIAEGNKEDVDLAVKAAREAFDHGKWPRMSGFERMRILMKFADIVEENIEELAALDAIDAGKLFGRGKALDIPAAASVLRYYAGAADKIHGETLKMSRELQGYTLREPIGVVGHIIPWNFPSSMFFMKVSPALAAGCTVVLKPAEQTPLTALFYAHLSKLAGIPDGVLNVITGFGPTAGAAISSHMDIDKFCFTGSTEVGRIVMHAAATSNLKVVSLELGGKSPVIVMDDADVEKAIDLATFAILYNKVSKRQYESILSYIEQGKREGATLLTGANPAAKSDTTSSPQFSPTTVEEAIERANNTRYGLAAGIVTNDLNLANRLSRSIRAGIIWINCYHTFDRDCPYGGYKISGFGRDLGMQALDKYLQVKSVATPLYNTPWL